MTSEPLGSLLGRGRSTPAPVSSHWAGQQQPAYRDCVGPELRITVESSEGMRHPLPSTLSVGTPFSHWLSQHAHHSALASSQQILLVDNVPPSHSSFPGGGQTDLDDSQHSRINCGALGSSIRRHRDGGHERERQRQRAEIGINWAWWHTL